MNPFNPPGSHQGALRRVVLPNSPWTCPRHHPHYSACRTLFTDSSVLAARGPFVAFLRRAFTLSSAKVCQNEPPRGTIVFSLWSGWVYSQPGDGFTHVSSLLDHREELDRAATGSSRANPSPSLCSHVQVTWLSSKNGLPLDVARLAKQATSPAGCSSRGDVPGQTSDVLIAFSISAGLQGQLFLMCDAPP